ncbi:hypothetical protein CMV_002731 [Castanea mollissima]|uniref:Uncharacterized protein n=1 Tax=Castanea mollissima TaxID=60419 RepID=A0A8J4RVJ0_9ROSI|nr:hypothetical protein CMV_002731 [Castanea mollissima]
MTSELINQRISCVVGKPSTLTQRRLSPLSLSLPKDPYLSNWLETAFSLLASPLFPTIFFTAHFILPSPQSQFNTKTSFTV